METGMLLLRIWLGNYQIEWISSIKGGKSNFRPFTSYTANFARKIHIVTAIPYKSCRHILLEGYIIRRSYPPLFTELKEVSLVISGFF